jgi:hypothetical protein
MAPIFRVEELAEQETSVIAAGRCGKEKDLGVPGIEPGPSSPEPVALPTELFRFFRLV